MERGKGKEYRMGGKGRGGEEGERRGGGGEERSIQNPFIQREVLVTFYGIFLYFYTMNVQ